MKNILLVLILFFCKLSLASPFVYLTDSFNDFMVVWDLAKGGFDPSKVAYTYVDVGHQPSGITVDPLRNRVYVANNADDTVSIINSTSNKVISTVNVGHSPVNLVTSPSGTKLYVANYDDDTVSVINTVSRKAVATIPVGAGPYDLVVNPKGTYVYVANQEDSSVSVIINRFISSCIE